MDVPSVPASTRNDELLAAVSLVSVARAQLLVLVLAHLLASFLDDTSHECFTP